MVIWNYSSSAVPLELNFTSVSSCWTVKYDFQLAEKFAWYLRHWNEYLVILQHSTPRNVSTGWTDCAQLRSITQSPAPTVLVIRKPIAKNNFACFVCFKRLSYVMMESVLTERRFSNQFLIFYDSILICCLFCHKTRTHRIYIIWVV